MIEIPFVNELIRQLHIDREIILRKDMSFEQRTRLDQLNKAINTIERTICVCGDSSLATYFHQQMKGI